MKSLKEKAAELPEKPGCYLFKNKNKKIIYIGKAKNIKKRVNSYFLNKTYKEKAIVENGKYLEYFITSNEVEALILENNLIKKHKPKYNINLKDDKTYPYIELTLNEQYPGIYFSRKPNNKNSTYYGPYPSAGAVKRLISLIEKYFLVRTCKKNFSLIKSPCLKFHINRCSAPCVNFIDKKNYYDSAKLTQMFLDGKYLSLEKELQKEMELFSENLQFEKAAEIRDILFEIKKFQSSQFVQIKGNESFEAIAFVESENLSAISIMHFKNGRLLDKSEYIQEFEENIFQTFLEQYFYNLKFTTGNYYLNIDPGNIELLTNYLKQKFKTNVKIKIPQKGKYKNIINTAKLNAIEFLNKQLDLDTALKNMKNYLKLNNYPKNIECIDISHSSGTNTVGSVVRFKDGLPDKKNYRRFRIKETKGIDDFKSISEVVNRQYSRIEKENKILPDLIIIDGGKGQLNYAIKALKNIKLMKKCDIISLAKKEETIFSLNFPEGYKLDFNNQFSRIIIKLRDEAHRFAITYNRKLRLKNNIQTDLTNIKGIGKVKASKLLKKFKSVEQIKKTTEQELSTILTEKDIIQLKKYYKL